MRRPTRRWRARRRPARLHLPPPPDDPPKPPFLTDYTWNHTTLWAIKADPAITYVQSGFGPNFREQFAELRRRFPGEILLHLEWTAGNSKMMRGNAVAKNPDAIVAGGIPLVFFESEERLDEILRCCDEIGVFIANPHTYYLEEGGRHPNIADKRAAGLANLMARVRSAGGWLESSSAGGLFELTAYVPLGQPRVDDPLPLGDRAHRPPGSPGSPGSPQHADGANGLPDPPPAGAISTLFTDPLAPLARWRARCRRVSGRRSRGGARGRSWGRTRARAGTGRACRARSPRR